MPIHEPGLSAFLDCLCSGGSEGSELDSLGRRPESGPTDWAGDDIGSGPGLYLGPNRVQKTLLIHLELGDQGPIQIEPEGKM
jgi:hypothetical protein